ncbi:collectin-10-like isoform X2 [Ruditapes philippinarum]|uniref:collectin-10-like isoform X2 n=1 Tax=Ruditapes philippinarum TaxID=129788 RepID=UPI00295A9B51|nr:collectin-10-like isoform X2 [Ruditapes philippinarum]
MIVLLKIVLFLVYIRPVYLMDKKHLSKMLAVENGDRNIFIFETVLGYGLNHCVGSCKAKKMCEYINFNVKADMCSLIGTQDKATSIETFIEERKGFIFGQKADWNMGEFEICNNCEARGECKPGQDEYAKCQHSGCGPPDGKEHALIRGNMFTVGDKAEYKCSAGYKDAFGASGSQTTCQQSGVWTPVDIQCVPEDATEIVNNSVYLLDKNEKSWDDGKEYCKSIGGDLAVVNTNVSYDAVKNLTDLNDATVTWLGANDRENEGVWIWSDGKRVNDGFKKWHLPNPDNAGAGRGEDCLSMLRRREWNDAECHMLYWSICEIKIIK